MARWMWSIDEFGHQIVQNKSLRIARNAVCEHKQKQNKKGPQFLIKIMPLSTKLQLVQLSEIGTRAMCIS